MLGDCICYMVIIACTILQVKNIVTSYKRDRIRDAIRDYHMDIIHHHDYSTGIERFQVEYYDMESYMATFLRLCDWSYKRILPKCKYEIIKPYIK